jgi:NAD(P)-dependent dehydrogenase (short-subunit alcohol dehydrogenase family)/ketosteroid isomerase-like protein
MKTWFITGASRGFGRIWAEAALSRGDKVAATARKVEDIGDLKQRFGEAVLALPLDVNDTEQVKQAVAQAHANFGRLDIVLNNAGYSLVGMIEEGTEADVRALFETNYFGMLRVIQTALPFLRKQGSGHIVGVSSGLGITAIPLMGFYCATKWAVEALHESLAQEVKAFGIKVTLVEPGAYATEFAKAAKISDGMKTYEGLRKQVLAYISDVERGDPEATSEAILKLVDAENPPLRLGLGTSILPRARAAYAERLKTWEAWENVSNAAMGEPRKPGMEWIEELVQQADTKTLIERAYSAFNKRDIDRALALMTEDVSWPKASEGGKVAGKEEIRAYWTRQWGEFDPHVEPLAISEEEGDKVRVRVHQLVKSLQGDVLSDSEVLHVFTVKNGLIAAMELGDEADATRGPSAAFAHRS